MNIGVGEALLIALCGFVTVFLLLIFLIVVIKIISAVVVSLQKQSCCSCCADRSSGCSCKGRGKAFQAVGRQAAAD